MPGGVARHKLIYAPRVQRDLLALQVRDADRILDDLTLLETIPWPAGKVKRLQTGDFWEIKTGDFRTIFWPQGSSVVILRVVNRRDLERTLGRINMSALITWLQARGPSG